MLYVFCVATYKEWDNGNVTRSEVILRLTAVNESAARRGVMQTILGANCFVRWMELVECCPKGPSR